MRNLIGLEMVCFCRSRWFELTYSGGGYFDEKGEPVPDIMDIICFNCSTSYFTREGDPIGYCPNCAHVERKRFPKREDLLEWLQGNDLSWLGKNRMKAATVKTFEGDWRLAFAKDIGLLDASGQYREVRKL